jgi:hypothetical protein
LRRGDHELPIANFRAVVVERVERSGDVKLRVRIEIGDQVQEIDVAETRLESAKWVTTVQGAAVWPGPGTRQHLLTTIALLSQPRTVTIHDHLGWVADDAGRWQYLDAEGTLDDDAMRLKVDPPLDRYVLPRHEGRPTAILDLMELRRDDRRYRR